MEIKLFSYDLSSRTFLLLRYNCDCATLPFNKFLSMGSYDFVTADKFGK